MVNINGFVVLGMFALTSGLIQGTLEKQGRTKAAQNLLWVSRAVFWGSFALLLYKSMLDMVAMFESDFLR